MNNKLREDLFPTQDIRVFDILREVAYDVSHWSFDRNDDPINPYTNSNRNSEWAFGGDGQPTVIFLWHSKINWISMNPEFVGDASISQDILDKAADPRTPLGDKQRFAIRKTKQGKLRELLYQANKHKTAVRVVLITGREVSFDTPDESSKASARKVDPVPWYLHSFDGVTGRYRIVRGVQPPLDESIDLISDEVDPVDDPSFQEFLGTLSDTERSALIKTRVDHGLFRNNVIERWKGCAVTGCKNISFLIASHIKPWASCTSRYERLTVSNGLLLSPNLDKVFDRGGISFGNDLRIIFSPILEANSIRTLNLNHNDRLLTDSGEDLLPFLEWHRTNRLSR